MTERPWYEQAFGPDYLELYPHRDLDAARAEAAGLAARGLAGRVLDLGCGFGRHVLAFLELGLLPCGLDRSPELLARAAHLPGGERLAGRLVRGDFRALPFAARAFDGAVLLFSSFGYFDDGENGRVLGELARVLAPDGRAVLDLLNPARLRATLVPLSRTERGGRVVEERRSLVDGARRVRKDVRLVERDGTVRTWHEDLRLYAPAELGPLLARAGLALLRVEGDFDGRPFADDAPRAIAWVQRPACT